MGTRTRRLYAVGGFLTGLAFMAPVIWYYVYKTQHAEAAIRTEAMVFFAAIGLIGLNLTLRSLWIMIRGI